MCRNALPDALDCWAYRKSEEGLLGPVVLQHERGINSRASGNAANRRAVLAVRAEFRLCRLEDPCRRRSSALRSRLTLCHILTLHTLSERVIVAQQAMSDERIQRMSNTPEVSTPNRNVLVVGASRGLGEAVVETYVGRGARVVGTVQNGDPSPLRDFAHRNGGTVGIEQVDITEPGQIAALRERLAGKLFDLLFVVAGISLAAQDAVGAAIDTLDFQRMMDTNVLGVMRTVEQLQDLVDPHGTIAVMSSGQGSVSANTTGGFEVYRATKSALNQMFRSHAVRHAGEQRALLLMAPGWVKTSLGGPNAKLEISDSIPPLVDTIDAQHGVPGLQYLDRHGRTVPW